MKKRVIEFDISLSNTDPLTRGPKIPETFGISGYSWENDLVLNVNKSVIFNFMKLKELPFIFGEVEGNFNCFSCGLESLKGSPSVVKGSFDCGFNSKLLSLEGCPKFVGGNFYCTATNLESLDHLPDFIGGDIHFDYNRFDLSLSEQLVFCVKYKNFYKTVSIVDNPDQQTTINNLKKKIFFSEKVFKS